MNEASSRILSSLLEARTGQQLTMSRRWRIETALQAVMRARGIDSIDRLAAALIAGRAPGLADEVVEALLNNETYFFRDRAPFDLLLGAPLDGVERRRARERRIAIWCAGCSTGQEAYSLAMALAEQAPRWAGWRVDIVGTDVSGAAIERARQGLYSQFEVQRGLPVRQMIRWFGEEGRQQWRIAPELRQAVRFEQRSLLAPPPAPGRFDIILCRNVLLYFSAATRRQAFDRLAGAARDDGLLMLGAAETVIGQTDAFASDPVHRGLYVKRPAVAEERRAAAL